jgi:hypothetical protein
VIDRPDGVLGTGSIGGTGRVAEVVLDVDDHEGGHAVEQVEPDCGLEKASSSFGTTSTTTLLFRNGKILTPVPRPEGVT